MLHPPTFTFGAFVWQRIDPRCCTNTERCSSQDQRAECIVACSESTVDVSLKDADWQGGGGEVDTCILTD